MSGMQASPEGDPKKLAWFKDARWTTNHPLPVLTKSEAEEAFPMACGACVFGEKKHAEWCKEATQ